MGEMLNAYKILMGKPEGKRPRRVLGVDVRTILKRILNKLGLKMIGFKCLRIEWRVS
jgi:hypothetical protein